MNKKRTCRLPKDVPAADAGPARALLRVRAAADPVELEALGERRAVVVELAQRAREVDRGEEGSRRRRRRARFRRRRRRRRCRELVLRRPLCAAASAVALRLSLGVAAACRR